MLYAASFGTCGAVVAQAPSVRLTGVIRNEAGTPLAGVVVQARGVVARTDPRGAYELLLPAGSTRLEVRRDSATAFSVPLALTEDRTFDVTLRSGTDVTVHAGQDVQNADPTTQGFTRDELMDANPGRTGVPLSIPGYPAETASGGIKAPQYFAPGVAGDHGEPIAQFFNIGGSLFQNNLTANAHGNGYADPNPLIGQAVDGVLVDSAGYNVRYGDHSVNLAVTYDVPARLRRFLQMTTDGRDGGLVAGWAPRDDRKKEWVAIEVLWGNGFLKRAEERQQYKINTLRVWDPGHHELSAYGIAYYGFSRIPGLIPVDVAVPDDTIDQRQADLTHTTIALLSDRWQIAADRSLTSGAYLRTYSLNLRSNFGDGLIRQSEFRTVAGGSTEYTQTLSRRWTALGGFDIRRDAPRGLDLAHADAQGFDLVTSNDLTITHLAPYAAVQGTPVPWASLYLGVRREEVGFNNVDRLTPTNSFQSWPGLTAPKASVTFGSQSSPLPAVSLSFAKAFHANDPRIGTGSSRGALLVEAREFQLFATKQVMGAEFRLTLAHIANSAELAKIDADTGLQENVGPSLNHFMTLAILRRWSRGWFQTSWSEADARARTDGTPIPEAPRMIVDAVGGWKRLPLGLDAKAEYEYVKAKPLGDGITGTPLQEIRLGLNRSFADGRWVASLQGQLNSGYTGQTTETLAVGQETTAIERAVGVPARSYATASLLYVLGR